MLDWYEPWHSSTYRQKAVDEIYEHVCADDKASHGISIGPVCVSLSWNAHCVSYSCFNLIFDIALQLLLLTWFYRILLVLQLGNNAFSALTLLIGQQEGYARCKWILYCQLMPLPPIISCFIKILNGLPFWCQLIQVVLKKRPLNGHSSPINQSINQSKLFVMRAMSCTSLNLRRGRSPVAGC